MGSTKRKIEDGILVGAEMNGITDSSRSSTILVLDCNCLGYVAKHSTGELTYRGQGTGVIFGFLQQMLRVASKFGSNRFVFCWDHPKSFRRGLYPDYKRARREKVRTPEEEYRDRDAKRQFDVLREYVLPKLGFRNIFYEEGYEADDLIDAVVPLSGSEKCVIVSSDEDLFQLLSRADIFNPVSKEVRTHEWFVNTWGIMPESWVKVKAIAGCPSDCVVGVYGIGLKYAVKYVRGDLNSGSKIQQIDKHRELIEKNMELVRLYGEELDLDVVRTKREQFYRKRFVKIFDEFGFMSFLYQDSMRRWVDCFSLVE